MYHIEETDVLIIGGGPAGAMAAIYALRKDPNLRVVVLDKSKIETSGAAGRGMDALNTIAVPPASQAEDMVEHLTQVTEGVLDQEVAFKYGKMGLQIIDDLEKMMGRTKGDLFPVDENGDYQLYYLHSIDFDFGQLQLMKGFAFVPLLIGLFAIPEVLTQLNRSRRLKGRAKIVAVESSDHAAGKLTWLEFKGSFRHMLRGGIVGLILGVIPGLGATPAAFVSYERAKRSSENPEKFGNGSMEGIAAAEAGNNAVNGATLVPLLTLGIPGDVITAVMLGAFMIFDLKPRPLLFIQHIDLIFGLFCALIMCDVALRLVGMVFIRYALLITRVPTSFVFPTVAILCVYGSYAINNSVFDIFTMFLFGVIGFIMLVMNMSPIPFLIAFVLAPMLEKVWL